VGQIFINAVVHDESIPRVTYIGASCAYKQHPYIQRVISNANWFEQDPNVVKRTQGNRTFYFRMDSKCLLGTYLNREGQLVNTRVTKQPDVSLQRLSEQEIKVQTAIDALQPQVINEFMLVTNLDQK
jgi:hypothetical protein